VTTAELSMQCCLSAFESCCWTVGVCPITNLLTCCLVYIHREAEDGCVCSSSVGTCCTNLQVGGNCSQVVTVTWHCCVCEGGIVGSSQLHGVACLATCREQKAVLALLLAVATARMPGTAGTCHQHARVAGHLKACKHPWVVAPCSSGVKQLTYENLNIAYRGFSISTVMP
jgi:hypothetical protein